MYILDTVEFAVKYWIKYLSPNKKQNQWVPNMMFNLMVWGTPLHSNLGLWGSFQLGLLFQTEQYGRIKAWTAQASTKNTSVLKAWNYEISSFHHKNSEQFAMSHATDIKSRSCQSLPAVSAVLCVGGEVGGLSIQASGNISSRDSSLLRAVENIQFCWMELKGICTPSKPLPSP